MVKNKDGAKRAQRELRQNYWGKVLVSVLPVLLLVVVGVNLSGSKVGFEYFEGSSLELKEKLVGGLPNVFLCLDSEKAMNNKDRVNSGFSGAVKILDEDEFADLKIRKKLEKFIKIEFYTMNCANFKEDVLRKYKIDYTKKPVVFLSQGSDEVIQITPTILSKSEDKKHKYEERGIGFASYLAKEVSRRFSISELKFATDLDSCTKKPLCGIFSSNKSIKQAFESDELREAVRIFRNNFPSYTWLYFDSSQFTLQPIKQQKQSSELQLHVFVRNKEERYHFSRSFDPKDPKTLAEFDATNVEISPFLAVPRIVKR